MSDQEREPTNEPTNENNNEPTTEENNNTNAEQQQEAPSADPAPEVVATADGDDKKESTDKPEPEKPAAATDTSEYADAGENDGNPDEIFGERETIRIFCRVERAIYAPVDGSAPGKDVTSYFTKAQETGQQIFHGGAFSLFEDFYHMKLKEIRFWYNEEDLKNSANDTFSLGRKPKSLFMCLVTVNPFDQVRKLNDERSVDSQGNFKSPVKGPKTDQTFQCYQETSEGPGTNMMDDDLIEVKGVFGGKNAPNAFQKLIEMLLRIKKRGLTVLPPDCMVAVDSAPEDEPWNFFAGHSLVEKNFFKSPDADELYFKIHADRKVLLEFAEKQALTLRTNPYSFGGGAGFIYTKELDEELRKSVLGFMTHFGDSIRPEEEFCKGKRDKETGEYLGWGFWVEVPQKMRLVIRMLREGWVFGGCGLQLDEMKEAGDLLINYFPIHNAKYQEAYGIDKWGEFTTLFNPFRALEDNELSLIHYFGESVTIYFSWMRQYVLYLLFPLVIGFVAGLLQEIDEYRNAAGAIFAILMSIWGVAWIRKWQRAEARFNIRWGQDVEAQQELVRDEFEYDRKKLVDVETIYTLDFEYPLTMQRLPDGTMVELVFPTRKRSLRRYLVSYPLLLLWCCAMVAGLFFIEWYRQKEENRGDSQIEIGASILSSLTTIIFSKVAAVIIDLFNDFENCRTDQEYEDELVLKSFAFNFVSTYFSVITIAIWPGVPNEDRITQLRAQMVTQQVAMPFVGNFIELIVPKILTNLQKRSDTLGGVCAAVCSYFCCCGCCMCCECCESCNYAEKKIAPGKTDRAAQGIELWKQAQKGRYVTTSGDYLEVTIQYGYMMMFAAAFPWAGVAAFFNNLIEIRVDAYKLLNEFQRPIARTSGTIGSWNSIFFLLTGLSIVSNSYYITVISPTPHEIKMDTKFEDLLEYFSFLQYFIAIAVILLGLVRGIESPSVKKASVKAHLLNDRAIQEYVKRQLALSPSELEKDKEARQKKIDETQEEPPCCECC